MYICVTCMLVFVYVCEVTPCTFCWLSNIQFILRELYETCYYDIIVLFYFSPFFITKKNRVQTIMFLPVELSILNNSWTYDSLVFNVALITVININSKMWKRSHRETAIRVTEVPQGRPRKESEFRCVYVISPSLDKILKEWQNE